jgi:hypothetical protein
MKYQIRDVSLTHQMRRYIQIKGNEDVNYKEEDKP